MRIVYAIIIWIVFVGGLGAYMYQRDRAERPTASVSTVAPATQASFTLLVTPTFTIEPDPFAVQIDDQAAAAALLIRMGQQEILRETEQVAGGIARRIGPLENVVAGRNEIYIQASPPVDQSDLQHAIRVQVLQDETVIAEHTYWSTSGGNVNGSLSFTPLTSAAQDGEHDHD